MIRILILLVGLLISIMSLAHGSGLFFNDAATGAPVNVGITLCLDARGPLSCQNYTTAALNLLINTIIPTQTYYPYAGIKVNKSGYALTGCTPISNGYCLFSASNNVPVNITIYSTNTNSNEPWYPSLEAFEHYNSGRSHVFSQAQFGGSNSGNNVVNVLDSMANYPSGYNMVYFDANNAFIYGGGYGNVAGSIGAFVAKINPDTLASIWYDQLINTSVTGEWDYPGSMGILSDGYIYVSYGYRLAKIDPNTGEVLTTLVLPTGGAAPENTSYNGFNATADGTIVMKTVYRQAGCTIQGPDALLDCPDPSDVPSSILVSVNPKTMQVIDNVTLPDLVGARPTVAQFQSHNYVYLLEPTTAIRYSVDAGIFTLDTSWNPQNIMQAGQTLCTSFVVIDDWVVAQTNTLPSETALSVIAINQGDASIQYTLQPFAGDPISPEISAVFSPNISWAPMSVSADPDNHLVYASDALPGEIAAISLNSDGLQVVWKANQRTTEFTALIGSNDNRVLVGTDIPEGEIPGDNSHDYAVWRNAATGQELARSPELPAMTQGTMIQPYYFGDMFFEGQSGTLIKLLPAPG